jgi:phosphoethanolamine N-methyltransferase
MGQNEEPHVSYTDELIDKCDCRWGEGFMSPGGPPEVAELLRPVDIRDCRVLDFGCGTGGVTSLLASDHGAGEVIGIDVQPRVLARAKRLVAARGLSDRISLRRVDPGPLDFPDHSFDVVFSVGTIIHHPDKPQLFRDFRRILRPRGHLVISDWYATAGPFTEEMCRWAFEGDHIFEMTSLKQTVGLARDAGFAEIYGVDRNAWFREEARRDLERLDGGLLDDFVARFGEESASISRKIAETFVLLAEQGQLRPGYLYARRLTSNDRR